MVHIRQGVEHRLQLLLVGGDDQRESHCAGQTALGGGDLRVFHSGIQLLDRRYGGGDRLGVVQLQIEVKQILFAEFHPGQQGGGEDGDEGDHQRPRVKAVAQCDADGGGAPHAGGGGQAGDDGLVADEDGAGAEKTDAGDDLGGDAGHVPAAVQRIRYKEAHQGGHTGPQTHQDVGAHAGSPAVAAALHADEAAQQQCQQQAYGNGDPVECGEGF